jgi:cytochrome o ubiquinol oxidase operon protein cyoD
MKSYILGFVFATVLTLIAYFMVVNHTLSGGALIGAIMGLASVQLLVQLFFFLHFGQEKGSGWNQAAFYFMVMVLVIIVGGTLWIMYHLNYNMMAMPSDQMDHYMLQQGGKGF